jgi:hypothetical protein
VEPGCPFAKEQTPNLSKRSNILVVVVDFEQRHDLVRWQECVKFTGEKGSNNKQQKQQQTTTSVKHDLHI